MLKVFCYNFNEFLFILEWLDVYFESDWMFVVQLNWAFYGRIAASIYNTMLYVFSKPNNLLNMLFMVSCFILA